MVFKIMAHYIEPNKELISAGYWDGLDINATEPFRIQPEPVYLSPLEQHRASIALAHCLDEVMIGNREEAEIVNGGSLDPSATEMPDGTVLILDTESLNKYAFVPGHEAQWKDPEEMGDPPIGDEYLDMWSRRQPAAEDADFGEEVAVFGEEDIIYTRSLRWGVLLTRGDESGKRLVGTWGFASPRTSAAGVVAPVHIDNVFGRGAEALPLTVGDTQVQADIRSFHFGIRTIERVNAVRAVK